MTLAPETLAPETSAPESPAPGATGLKVRLRLTDDWFTACDLGALLPGRGVAALLPDGGQVALFRDRDGGLYAIDNRDPFTGAAVLSRGLTGTHRGRPFVASPLLKQRFDLTTGECLDDEEMRVETYQVQAVRAVRAV
ncbi:MULTISPECIES: nitrite reductase small subunit NirD [unclassified Streptomyces]|uniref:nitrite reductase small subunit NirD n=1 Tax=unclassified Streptomyces TaxID=2593676 RepID=UPI0026F31088|nr:nitrite reductase small subunit NirD [Streptomyces sp. HUAS CX7]WKX21167.1 nitrite reductase small subunit NirD [Streptomyces sp. HUAS CX7]